MSQGPGTTASSRLEVAWSGHATVTVTTATRRLISDPLLTRRVAHLRRRVPLDPTTIADIDVVLITHAHLDHLHLPSLRLLGPQVRVLVPRGAGRLLRRADVRHVDEVVVGERIDLGDDVVVEAVPARHPSGRGPHSRVQADPVGYLVHSSSGRVYLAGDTDLFPEMESLATVTVAALPIWGWGPTIGPGHLDPERAVEAAARLDAHHVLPIHWGTYAPEDMRQRPAWFDRPAQEFAALMARRGWSDRLHLLPPGGWFAVEPPTSHGGPESSDMPTVSP